METAISSDILAVAQLLLAISTLAGVIAQLVNSFRNSKKIDATHDIAVQTMQQTSRVYLPTAKKDD
jgi:hypothetical protein